VSWGPAAGDRIIRSRAEININIVDVAHGIFVIAKCWHDLVFAAAEILPAANNDPEIAGADARSSNFYLRTKGEAEAAVRACGYLRVDNARPSFLLGQRAEARIGERVGIVAAKMVAPLLIGPLMIYHPIPAASVARALVNLSFRDEPGVFIQQYSELVAAD
jgi:hypothetical protein